jgi:myo-inositol-1(or 4)-monophosphatase
MRNKLAAVVKKALEAGGKVLKQGARQRRNVSYKTPLSPVTQVDIASEKVIVSIIRKAFPTHGFLAEEMSHYEKSSTTAHASNNYRWIIDPLDGTVNFVHRIPQSCVSIAVERAGIILAGGVYDPYRDELFLAVKGKGATLNGKRIHVSPETKMHRAVVITGFPYDRNDHATRYLDFLRPFLKKCADLRRFGAAALDLAWIACGRAEAFLEYKLSPWDIAAGMLLVEEAGGKVSDFKNQKVNLDNPYTTLASNGRLHPGLLKLLK